MRFDKILRGAIIAGVFVLPFVPFVVMNSMFFPFITGKNFLFRIVTEIIFSLWVILALKNTTYRPSFSWIPLSIITFISIITLADLCGENLFKSFWSNFERMEGMVGLLHLGAYFFVVGTVFNTKKLWWFLANTSVVASIVMGIYGLRQIAGDLVINQGGVRVDGTFGNAAYLAVYMLFHVFITAILISKWRGTFWVRYVYAGALLLQLYILFETATRGTILGLAGGMLLASCLVALFGADYPRIRKASIGLIILVLLSVSSVFMARNTDFVKKDLVLSRLASISLSEGSSRFTIWNMALEGFKERPILGWGQENFNYVFNTYYNPSLYKDEPWFDRAHNIFFDWLIAGGALGLLSYLLIFGATLFYLWRRESRVHFSILERSLLTGLLAGYFFHNIFVFDNIVSYILFFTVLAYIYSETRQGLKENSIFLYSFSHGMVNRVIVPLVIIIASGVLYFVNIPGMLTSYTMIKALSTSNIEERTKLFEKAGSYGSLGSQEVAEQLVQAAIGARNSNATLGEKQAIYTLAESKLKEQIMKAPRDARFYVFLGSLYDQYGQLNKAQETIQQALQLSPQKQRIMYQLAFSYLNAGENDKAFEIFKKAYELEPQSDESTIYYAALAIFNGNNIFAESLLENIRAHRREQKVSDLIDDNLLLQAYAQTGQYEKVLAIWDYRVAQDPPNATNHLSRAATLVRLERNGEAVQEIQTVITLDPRFKEQGEMFIKEIQAGRGDSLIQ
ncbi:MAG TPA: O-antigen ligase family protein [Candidatus Paceibacterota bacterium]